MRWRRRNDGVLLYSILSLWALASASPQRGAMFRGLITDSARAPIPGVEVTMLEAHRVAHTDSAGVFVFRDVPAGVYSVVARHPRFHPLEGTVRLAEGDSIEYRMPRMRRLAQTLDTVRVNETKMTAWWQSDFDRRKATEHGAFITREDLDARATWPLANIIAAKSPGLRLVQRHCGAAGFCGWTLASSRPAACLSPGCSLLCFLAVWMDGQPIYLPAASDAGGAGLDLSKILPSDVGAVEVYTNPGAIPPQFNMSGSACGVILLWRRTAGGGET
jgi:hypothetical protein